MWRTRKRADYFRQCVLIAVALLSLCRLEVASATCRQLEKPYTFNISVPASLSVVRDTVNGTVIYSSEEQPFPPDVGVSCDGGELSGVKNLLGPQPESQDYTAIFPIGTTGLGFRWRHNAVYVPAFGIDGPTTVLVYNGYSSLELIKIGPIQAGAEVPAGKIAYYAAGTQQPWTLALDQKIVIDTPTCTTPSVRVDMGDQKNTSFKGLNTRLAPINASIKLNACPAGIATVKYRLDPTTEILNAASSVIALSGDSTATGVGVQILDDSNQPLPLGQDISFTGYDTAGGSFVIPFNVAYYQVASTVKAGKADTALTFTMTYQ